MCPCICTCVWTASLSSLSVPRFRFLQTEEWALMGSPLLLPTTVSCATAHTHTHTHPTNLCISTASPITASKNGGEVVPMRDGGCGREREVEGEGGGGGGRPHHFESHDLTTHPPPSREHNGCGAMWEHGSLWHNRVTAPPPYRYTEPILTLQQRQHTHTPLTPTSLWKG